MSGPTITYQSATSSSLTYTSNQVLTKVEIISISWSQSGTKTYTPATAIDLSGSYSTSGSAPNITVTVNNLSASATYSLKFTSATGNTTPTARTTSAGSTFTAGTPTVTSTTIASALTSAPGSFRYVVNNTGAPITLNSGYTYSASTVTYTGLTANTVYSNLFLFASGYTPVALATATTNKTFTATYSSKTATTVVYDVSSAYGLPASITSSSGSAALSGSTLTISSLTANTAYTFTLSATGYDNVTTGSVTTTLAAPTMNPASAITSSGAIISWLAPGTPLSYYNLYRDGVFDLSTNVATYTYNTLAANTNYSITVSAVNANGESPTSSAATFTTNKTFTATYSSKTATTVVYDVSSAYGLPASITSSSGSAALSGSTLTISSLTANTAYTFTLSATGYDNVITGSVTTLGALDASATFVSADYTNGYTLTYDLSGTGTFPDVSSAYTVTGVANPTITIPQTKRIIIGGLSEYTEYSFTVSVSGFEGTATTSPQRTLDRTNPDYPIVSVDVSDSKLTLTWPNIEDSGSPMTNYYIFDISGETDTANALYTLTANTTNTQVITGLTNGITYTYYIRAKDTAGNLGAPATVYGKPANTPSASTIVAAVTGNEQIIVNWSAGYDGGSTVTAWQVSKDNGANYTTVVGPSSATITDVSNNTEYIIVVRAVNAAGSGTPSASRAITVVDSIATYVINIINQVGANSISISDFKANLAALATQNGPAAIQVGTTDLSSLVTSTASGVSLTNKPTTVLAVDSGNSLVVNANTDLSNNALYISDAVNLTINAIQYNITFPSADTLAVGNTEYSLGDNLQFHRTYKFAAYASGVLLPVPSEPQNLTSSAGNGEITLAWSAPSDFGGDSSVTYTIEVLGGAIITDISNTLYTVTELINNQNYTIRVYAVNSNGAGNYASIIDTPTYVSGGGGSPPSAPTGLTATCGDEQIVLSWSAVTGATSYSVMINSGSLVTDISNTTYTFTGLTNGQMYTIQVAAVNAYGTGSYAMILASAIAPGGGVPCFFGNAPVLTKSGYRRMDSLRAGDKVLTPTGTEVTIERVKVTRCVASQATNPYIIPQGRFGAERRVLISPNHKVVSGSGLVEARHLGLQQEERQGELTYYNLELTDQAHMVVGGVAVESLAPVRRMVLTMNQFKAALHQKHGASINSEAVLANIQRTCRFLADGRIEVPVLKRH